MDQFFKPISRLMLKDETFVWLIRQFNISFMANCYN